MEGTYAERLRTFFVDLIPRAFGMRDLALDWQPNAIIGPALYLGLLVAVVGGVVALVRRPGPRSRILLPAVLVGVFPIMALFENLIFANDGRYGIISFPFLVLAVAIAVDAALRRVSPTVAIGVGVARRSGVDRRVDRADGRSTRRRHRRRPERASSTRSSIASTRQASTASTAATGRCIPVDFVGDNRIVGAVFPFWPIRFPDRQRVVGATPPDEVAVLFLDDRRGSRPSS